MREEPAPGCCSRPAWRARPGSTAPGVIGAVVVKMVAVRQGAQPGGSCPWPVAPIPLLVPWTTAEGRRLNREVAVGAAGQGRFRLPG